MPNNENGDMIQKLSLFLLLSHIYEFFNLIRVTLIEEVRVSVYI